MDGSEKVTDKVSVWMSHAMFERMRELADEEGVSIANVARRACFNEIIRADERQGVTSDAQYYALESDALKSDALKEKENEKEKKQKKELKEKGIQPTTRVRELFSVPSLQECKEYAANIALCQRMDVDAFYDYFTSNGWLVGGRVKMRDWRAAMRSWARREPRLAPHRHCNIDEARILARDMQAERDRAAFLRDRAQAAQTRDAWRLCEERCAFWRDEPGHYCCQGAKWPPCMNDRPIPPEECRRYKPLATACGADDALKAAS